MRYSYAVALALSFVMLLSAGAYAGVLLSPARLEAVVGTDGETSGVLVANRGEEAVVVRFSLVGGGHDLDGQPVFNEAPEVRSHFAEQIHISPSQVLLAPGEATRVAVTVQDPLGAALYPALMADILPVDPPKGAWVAATRIAIPMLLTYAPSVSTLRSMTAESVRVTQAGQGTPLRLEAIVHNTGSVHVRAGGSMAITGPGLADTIRLKPVTVLPGFARRIQAEWSPAQLPPGEYRVQYIPDLATGHHATVASSFYVAKPYLLACADLSLEQLRVEGDTPGTLKIRALVVNRGAVAAATQVKLTLAAPDGPELLTHRLDGEVAAESGCLLTDHMDIRGITPGDYRLRAGVWHNQQQVAVVEQPLRLSAAAVAVREP